MLVSWSAPKPTKNNCPFWRMEKPRKGTVTPSKKQADKNLRNATDPKYDRIGYRRTCQTSHGSECLHIGRFPVAWDPLESNGEYGYQSKWQLVKNIYTSSSTKGSHFQDPWHRAFHKCFLKYIKPILFEGMSHHWPILQIDICIFKKINTFIHNTYKQSIYMYIIINIYL